MSPNTRQGGRPVRKATRALGALALIIGSAAIPSTAFAGQYQVHVCRDGGGNPGTITLAIEPQYSWVWTGTTNCDGSLAGYNGLQVHVTDGQADPSTEPGIPANASGNIYMAVPDAGSQYLGGVGVDAGRFAMTGSQTGFHTRMMVPSRNWCVFAGYGGAGCPGRGGDADRGTYDWWDGNYPWRQGVTYGGLDGGNKDYAFGVVCNGGSTIPSKACYRTSFKPSGGVSMTSALIQVADVVPPTAGNARGEAWDGLWHRPGNVSYGFDAWDAGSGIRLVQKFEDGAYKGGDKTFACRVDTMKPCDDQAVNDTVSVGAAYDGFHTLLFRTLQGADQNVNCGEDCVDMSTTVRTDGTAPGAPALANSKPGWQKVNRFPFTGTVPATETDPDGAGPRAQSPITTRALTVCPAAAANVDATCAVSSAAATATEAVAPVVTAPAEGNWKARVSMTDTAGNVGAQSAWVPVQYDATAPSLSVAEKPLAIAVGATDALSGVKSVRVKIDGGAWTSYSTATTSITLPAGRHDVLVDSIDNAGNATNPSGTDSGARLFTVTVIDPNASNVDNLTPVQTPGPGSVTNNTTIVTGGSSDGQVVIVDRGAWNGTNASDKATVTAWYQREDTKPTKKHAKKLADSTISSPTGVTSRTVGTMDRPVIRGRVVNDKGQGIGGARLDLLAVIPGGQRVLDKGGVRTREDGTFTLVLPRKQTSRSLSIGYRARVNDERSAASADLTLVVRSRATLAIENARVGAQARLSGTISATYLDAKGLPVALQFQDGRKWRTFATPRTDAKGKWSTTYRFSTRQTVKLRAFVASTASYPYKGGASRVVTVHVH